ncbi:MAG: hypothetical protein OEW87_07490 [Flavobacteriaceae bacterium]|nr:hypothetical protein [Flavobacteriaceae bacterium]
MKLIIKLFGTLMLLAGISLLIYPEFIIEWIEDYMEHTSLYISAIVVRFIFGILFLTSARESKYPGVIKVFGYIFIIAAIILFFIGQDRFQNFITSLIPEVKPIAPLIGLLVIIFGSFLIYSFSKNKELEQK